MVCYVTLRFLIETQWELGQSALPKRMLNSLYYWTLSFYGSSLYKLCQAVIVIIIAHVGLTYIV